MKRVLLAIALIAMSSPLLFAQTEGRIGVGGSLTINATTDDEVGTGKGVGLIVRLNPRTGWGPAGAFNWYSADLKNPSGASGDFARMRIRPLMGGVSYTLGRGSLLTSFSIVGGPSLNSVRFDSDYIRTGVAAIDADTSLAIRPGVGLTYTVRPRVALVGFGGFLINRPGIVYRDSAGNELRDRWKADGVVLSVGAVYSIF
jgi:hypothetical protein